ncbi:MULTISPECIES: class I SAM-dependent methyltransferase [Paenibacillus]|uniref:Methyltransferase type 11 n=2 Tax=Paenibacillus lactis TaxID=228574 RepID=G4HAD9_9BACL|nr:class I SAM-dependent methyltransferase [Paenibacillus lactis]EHB66898.1 Methyltransferase type 11 [Paenibacillus lactis 154]MBP1893596.1 SAM-dependent methyltransferase [Paenibacillus lactis]
MTQNIYDHEDFFQGYSQLNRSIHGLGGAPEWAALQSLLPDMKGIDVLDLGCGFGWFCRWAKEHGAISVVGIDVSAKMLARAKDETKDPQISYLRADLETIELERERYDLVYSSLAFHYIEDIERLLKQAYDSLKAGGRLVCSIEHPIYTASQGAGWIPHPNGFKTWPVDHYQFEGPRTTNWLAEGVIKQHRTIGTYLNLLIRVGFTITHVEDWGPADEQLAVHPEWEEESHRPMFLLISGTR